MTGPDRDARDHGNWSAWPNATTAIALAFQGVWNTYEAPVSIGSSESRASHLLAEPGSALHRNPAKTGVRRILAQSPKSNTVFRAADARTFETPFNENLILSSGTGTGGLAQNVFGSQSEPVKPGNRNQFNAGLQQGNGRWVIIDADYFWKYTQVALGFSCDGVFATYAAPITTCSGVGKSKLVTSCLYGCFSKPPDVVVSNGGRVPTFPAALWVCRTVVERSARSEPKFTAGGAHKPSNMASVAARVWDLIRELRGKHHILGSAETTG